MPETQPEIATDLWATDLWGPDFRDDRPDPIPVALLKAQAEALTRRTAGRLVGSVEEELVDGTVWASLSIEVPTRGDFRHKLLPLTPFPMTPFPKV